jgi:GNAT superfamily N-acetyltransferase
MRLETIAEGDYPEWLELWQGYLEFYETQLDPAITANTFQRIIDAEIHGVLAKNEAGQAIGLVHCLEHYSTWSFEKVCYLEDLYVTPSSRGEGVGEALISHVVDWAKRNDFSKIYWLTKESNTIARKLYDKVANQTGFIQYEITNLY